MLYPENPKFDTLSSRGKSPLDWKDAWAIDPALIEDNGVFYAFSADTKGADLGGQIRSSNDLIHWNYLSTVFTLDKRAYAKNKSTEQYGNLYESFYWCRTFDSDKDDYVKESGEIAIRSMCPIKGKDGKFWLYYSMQAKEGSSRAIIGLAKADTVMGAYSSVGVIVATKAGYREGVATHPFAFWDKGELYLLYGESGLRLLKLDPETGLRSDGITRLDYDDKACSFDDYFGKAILYGATHGGSIVVKDRYYLVYEADGIKTAVSDQVDGGYIPSREAIGGDTILFHYTVKKYDDVCGYGRPFVFETSGGVGVLAYTAQTHAVKPDFLELLFRKEKVTPFLFVHRYYLDASLHLNFHRFGGESLSPVTKEDFLAVSSGVFLVYREGKKPAKIKLNQKISLENGILTLETNEVFRGRVFACWDNRAEQGGITATLQGVKSGETVYLTSFLAEKNKKPD